MLADMKFRDFFVLFSLFAGTSSVLAVPLLTPAADACEVGQIICTGSVLANCVEGRWNLTTTPCLKRKRSSQGGSKGNDSKVGSKGGSDSHHSPIKHSGTSPTANRRQLISDTPYEVPPTPTGPLETPTGPAVPTVTSDTPTSPAAPTVISDTPSRPAAPTVTSDTPTGPAALTETTVTVTIISTVFTSATDCAPSQSLNLNPTPPTSPPNNIAIPTPGPAGPFPADGYTNLDQLLTAAVTP